MLTGDLRDVSDRVLRVILNEFRRTIEQLQWNVFIHQFCRKVWRWWVDACALSGAMPMPDYYPPASRLSARAMGAAGLAVHPSGAGRHREAHGDPRGPREPHGRSARAR
ncbi:hypothetical protein [Burkholderia thailandensis]|uniref:hypothetical protein n=1 Tax=Burkholderia thailandensis TaxID=57975 RepID=UPI0009E20B14|nr:hypothetical protein [Burkholderia thailandensis]